MALYDIALGDGHQRDRGALLLRILGDPAVARFRDAWVEKGDGGEPVIAIYTRQGGGNRECYCEDYGRDHEGAGGSCSARSNEVLTASEFYIRDADDEFDRTYATFYFRAPATFREVLLDAAVDHVDTDARWQEAIDRIGKGEMRPAEVALGDQLGAFLSDPGDGPRVMEV